MYTVTVNGVSKRWTQFEYAMRDVFERGLGYDWTIKYVVRDSNG